MVIMSAFNQTNMIGWIFIVLVHLNKQSAGRHVAPLQTHYPDPGSTSLYGSYCIEIIDGCIKKENNPLYPYDAGSLTEQNVN